MRFVYTLLIHLFQLGVFLGGLFFPKARKRAYGNLHFRTLNKPEPGAKVVWMHCASLGEFEQGRPILEAYKAEYPQVQMLLTFFSPSGFDVCRNYEPATWVTYLPFDKPSLVRLFLDYFHPDVALFIKYEFWHNFIRGLHKRDIPLYLVSGIFRKDQLFFKAYGGFFRQTLSMFSWFFLQNKASQDLLESIGVEKSSISGDTRFDRVLQIARHTTDFPVVDAFCADNNVFILGSSWPEDERLLLPVLIDLLPSDWKIIVAPHELSESHIAKIATYFPPATTLRYTQLKQETISNQRIMILDTMGMLSAVYKKADVAYVGGGFGKGIHNTLEPAAFYIPVIFGPRHKQFQEANDLLAAGGGFTVSQKEEVQVLLKSLIGNRLFRHTAGQAAGNYVRQKSGATARVLEEIATINI